MDETKKEKVDIYDLPTFEELAEKQMRAYRYLVDKAGKSPQEAGALLDQRGAECR